MADPVGMLLCAGLGTRLRPLTDRVPKPAVPVCGVPLVRHSLALLAHAGVRRAVVNVHHLPDAMARAAEAAARALGIALAVSREPVIAGTGGALREARALLAGADAIFLVNGDILFDVNRHVYPRLMERGLVRAHHARGYWNDLGTPARYLAANEDVLFGCFGLHRFGGADPFDALEPFYAPGAWTGPRAHLDAG